MVVVSLLNKLDKRYIYQNKNWTDFTWDDKAINAVFGEVRLMQGKIIGQMNAMGFLFLNTIVISNWKKIHE